jgi:hypothetical protein
LEGLVFWVKDKMKRGIVLDPFTFDENALLESLQEMEGEDKADSVDVESPIKFTTEKWIQWEIECTNYLSAKKGTRGVPLSYVIRHDLAPNEIITIDDVTKQEIYTTPLEGAPYRRDNSTVWSLLRSFTIATPAWEWIKQLDARGDGRLGMQMLRSHYDGPDKRKARITQAEQDIANAHYKGERYFAFEKFVTKLTGAFQVLSHYNEPYPDNKKVRTLVSKINTSDLDILSAVTHIRANRNMLFDDAVNFMSDIVRTSVAAQAQARQTTGQTRRVASLHAPNTRARTGGRSGRAGPGRSVASGQSDRSSFISQDVWGMLTPQQRSAIVRDQNESESVAQYTRGGRTYHGRHDGRGRGYQGRNYRGSGRNISAVNVEHTDQSAMSVMTETQAPTPVNNNAGQAFGRGTQGHSNNSRISAITTDMRRSLDTVTLSRLSTKWQPGRSGRIEIDNHADTHALGCNFEVLSFTGRVCDVSPFADHYKPIKDVKIVTGVTAWDDPEGTEPIMIIVHEALWLGEIMNDSLLNPNQCRVHGISICDDPFDPHRQIGIHDPKTNITIPFKMFGTIVGLETRTPSFMEIQKCRHLVLNDTGVSTLASTLSCSKGG